jgi:hypothetical protein
MAETRHHGQDALDDVRKEVARHRLTVESIAVERRILREDFLTNRPSQ